MIDSGELRVDVAQRVPLTELGEVHARAVTGTLPSAKAVVVAA